MTIACIAACRDDRCSINCTVNCTSDCYTNICSTFTAPFPIVGTVTDTEGLCVHVVSYNYAELVSDNAANTGKLTLNEHVNDLRGAIDQERVRRGLPVRWGGSTITNGVLIDNAHLEDLRTGINGILYLVTSTYIQGTTSYANKIDTLRTNIELLRQECKCNGDCGGNSSCTCYDNCKCNYSDRRLKRDIRRL